MEIDLKLLPVFMDHYESVKGRIATLDSEHQNNYTTIIKEIDEAIRLLKQGSSNSIDWIKLGDNVQNLQDAGLHFDGTERETFLSLVEDLKTTGLNMINDESFEPV